MKLDFFEEGLLTRIRRTGGVFITGTDTGVGKSFVTALLGITLKNQGVTIAPFKPFSTGGRVSEDGVWLKRVLGWRGSWREVAPAHFPLPLAPWVASAELGRKVPWGVIRRQFRRLKANHEVVLVEGIGGVMVPLDQGIYVADVMKAMKLPAIVVARAGLGTINHTVLTVQALLARRIRVLGVVLNGLTGKDLSEKTNVAAIEACAGVPVLAVIPFQRGLRRISLQRHRPKKHH